jgi:hypothetical protein
VSMSKSGYLLGDGGGRSEFGYAVHLREAPMRVADADEVRDLDDEFASRQSSERSRPRVLSGESEGSSRSVDKPTCTAEVQRARADGDRVVNGLVGQLVPERCGFRVRVSR